MEESAIYNEMQKKTVYRWKEEIEEHDECFRNFREIEEQRKKDLSEQISEALQHELHMYVIAVENRLDYLYYNLIVKVLNTGIHMGMDLQSAFHAEEE